MLQFIFGPAKSGKTEKIFELLKEKAATGCDSLLFVPEQFSFETERLLLEKLGDKNAAAVKVFSFSSICSELKRIYGGSCGKTVTDTSRLIILQKILKNLKSELQIFCNTSAVESVKTVNAAITELKQASLSAKALHNLASKTDNEILKMKLNDLSLILGAYEATLKDVYIDPLEDLDAAGTIARNNGYFKGKSVFFDAYNGFTGQQYRFINTVISDAEEVYAAFDYSENALSEFSLFSGINDTVAKLTKAANNYGIYIKEPLFLKSDYRRSKDISSFAEFVLNRNCLYNNGEDVKIVAAATRYDELEFVAKTIRKAVRTEGLHYRDFAVVARNASDFANAAKCAFAKFDVPFFYDEKQQLNTMQLAAFITFALSASRSFKSDDILHWLKSGLTDYEDDVIAELDNYIYLWGIDGDDWLHEWKNNPYGLKEADEKRVAEKLKMLNGYRTSVLARLGSLSEIKVAACRDICKAVFEFLTDCGVPEKLCEYTLELEKRGDNTLKQYVTASWSAVCEILDSIVECYGDEEVTMTEFREILGFCFENSLLSGIPQSMDSVTLTSADRLVPIGVKTVFAVGVNYGEFPSTVADTGIFTVNERAVLNSLSVEIDDKYLSDYIYEGYLFYRAAAAPTDKLYLIYRTTGSSGEICEPSQIIKSAVKCCEIKPHSFEPNCTTCFETVSEAFSAACKQTSDKEKSSIFDLISDFDEFREKMLAIDSFSSFASDISKATAKKLYGTTLNISPSKVEQYYKCPYAYFLKYGLNIREREHIDFKQMQRGTIAHFVLENVLKNHFDELNANDTEKIAQLVNEYIALYLAITVGNAFEPSGEAKYLLKRISETLSELLPDIIAELKLSCFKPIHFELSLSPDGDFKPLTLKCDGYDVNIIGTIDRVDEYFEDGKIYLRVVDYKTGKKLFGLPDILYGLNLQMLVYMCAVCEQAPSKYRPAAVIYQPVNPKTREGIYGSEKEAQKPKGVLTDDVKLLRLMDPSGEYMPFKLTKNEVPQKNDICISLDDFYAIFDFLKNKISDMAKSLRNGYIKNEPSVADDGVCDFCDYRALCTYTEDKNTEKAPKLCKDEVLEIIRNNGGEEYEL